ncbi:TPA: sugar ABC transporter ATP-binding protein [Legionella pneumophila]|nr:sugar ABC transporter ATP-binding protein [Legionella pneumophila]
MINSHQTQPLLRLENIEKSYGSHRILNKVSFCLYPGEITALIGDNGAGKSTLVQIISGYIQADKGNIYWQEQPLCYSNQYNAPFEMRRLGIQIVHQQLALIDELSIWRNFFLGNEINKKIGPFKFLNIRLMQHIASQFLQSFGLVCLPNIDLPVKKLSGGERQMLVVCRAKYFNAKLLILDEPTSALSPAQADKVLQIIKNIAQAGIAIVFITHNPAHIQNTAHKVIKLSCGTIEIMELTNTLIKG